MRTRHFQIMSAPLVQDVLCVWILCKYSAVRYKMNISRVALVLILGVLATSATFTTEQKVYAADSRCFGPQAILIPTGQLDLSPAVV